MAIMRNRTVDIDFQCNDPESGVFIGKVAEIAVGELEFYAHAFHGYTYREMEKGFAIAGKSWPTISSKDWVGNWARHSNTVTEANGVAFLVWLHRRRLFHCHAGPVVATDWLEGPIKGDHEYEAAQCALNAAMGWQA